MDGVSSQEASEGQWQGLGSLWGIRLAVADLHQLFDLDLGPHAIYPSPPAQEAELASALAEFGNAAESLVGSCGGRGGSCGWSQIKHSGST